MTTFQTETGPWLVIIDGQRIFADPTSPWGSPMWADALPRILALADAFGPRVLKTRWVPPDPRVGSWGPYMDAWPFADRPADDPLYDFVPELEGVGHECLVEHSFGKFGPRMESITGGYPHLVLTGVSTDCCVISTALPAADAGATLTLVTDACAGSTPENHAAALTVMGLFPPQITLTTTADLLAAGGPEGAA